MRRRRTKNLTDPQINMIAYIDVLLVLVVLLLVASPLWIQKTALTLPNTTPTHQIPQNLWTLNYNGHQLTITGGGSGSQTQHYAHTPDAITFLQHKKANTLNVAFDQQLNIQQAMNLLNDLENAGFTHINLLSNPR